MTNKKTLVGDRRKNTRSTRLLPYGVAFLTVALALELTQLLLPWLYPTTTPLFFVAVMMSAWYGGLNAGLLATILSTLAINYFFIEPINSFQVANIGTIARLSAFLITAGLISSLNQSRSNALKKSQEALQTLQEAMEREQTTKEQLEKVLSSINDGVYVLDHDWRFTYVNDRYCEMIEMERSAILGQNIWELFPAAIGTEADVQFRRAIREQTPLQFDYLYAPWNSWHDHRIYPSSSGLTVFLADITERKQAELMLVEQKRLLEMIASGQPLDDCLSALCNSVSRLNSGTRACFLLTDAQCKTFPRSITSDVPPSFGAGLKDAPINELCIGTCGEAVYRGQPITCADIANDDRWSQSWRDLCLAHGILACHSKPVIGIDQRPFGSLMLCFDEARMPTDWEHQLAEFGVQVASIVFERDRSLQSLRESEERLSLAIEGADMVTWDVDLQTGKTIWSANHFHILGYETRPSGEATVEMWQSCVHPDDLAQVMQAWEIAKEERSLYNPEYRIIRVDNGQIVWLAATGRFYYNQSGQAVRFVGVTFDVSDRKQAEADLRESEEQFRVLADCAPSLIWFNSADGGCEFVNKVYLDFFGKTLEELQGFGWQPYLHPDDETQYVAAYLEAFQKRKPFRAQVRAMRADGQYRWLDSYGLPRFSLSGNFLGYVGTSPDITELKQAEAALMESQQRIQSILDAIPHSVWILGADGEFHSNNQQWLNYYGMSFAEATTTGWHQLAPDDLEAVQQKWQKAMETGTPYEAEFRWRFADGSQRWYLCRAEPIRDELGKILEWVGTNTDITNLKQVETDLRESQHFTQQVAETLPGLLYVYDLSEQRNVYINRQSLELLGYTPEQIQEMGAEITLNMVHPDDLPQTIAYQAALSTASEGEVLELEHRVQDANGEWIWLLARSTIFSRTPEGDVQKIIGVAINITERKQIEAALQQSNDRFYAAMRAVEGIVFEWNLQTQSVYRSEGLFQLVGVRAEEAPPTSEWWAERVHPDDLKRLEAAFPSVIASRDRYEGEYRVRHEAGHWVDVWERGYLQRNSQGELIGVVGFTTDISERKKAEEALRASEERFRTLADNMSQLAWMTDETGWIFWYNQRWFDYTGTTLEEMQGWGWQKVHHPDHVDRVVAHFRQSIETGESWEDTFPLRGQDGIYRWFLSRALPIKDDEGRVLRWFGTNTDITERRQTQLQLQEQAQQLMQLNSDLKQSSEILAKRNQELDQFVYVVSHDLKAPLRAIANLSQWLEDDLAGQLPEENQHQMELLRQRVHRLEDFIDGLLAYSRVGRTEVAEEIVSISELLSEILDSLAPPVSFTIKVLPPMPSVVTKKLLLTQVFSNLISNAIKHHHRPDGKIIVSATEKGDGYEFIICDDGPGIAPEHHEKIFGIFQTLKASNTKDSTGIGLSIVKKILETEGGAIALESELGMGTTFRFTWPKQPKTSKDEMAISSHTGSV